MVYVVRCGARRAAPRSTRKPTSGASGRPRLHRNRKAKNSRQARAMAKGTRVRPRGAGGGVAERRGGCPVPPCRRRRARAQALQLPRGRAADGAGRRRRRQRRPAPERRGAHPDAARALHAARRARWCACSAPASSTATCRVQHPHRRRRPGDHRPAPGHRCGGEQPRRRACSSATSPTCPPTSAVSRPSCSPPTTAGRSGRSTRPAPCAGGLAHRTIRADERRSTSKAWCARSKTSAWRKPLGKCGGPRERG